MRRFRLVFLPAVMALLLPVFSPARGGAAEVGIGIYVSPPPYAFPAPPAVVLIPGTYYVYYVPGVDFEILFYHGYWWRPWHHRWYRARYYNGPWYYDSRPPRPLIALPPRYRRVPPRYRIPYPDLRRNWRAWERDRYWDRHRQWPERGPEGRGGRGPGMGGGMGRGRR